MSTCSVELPNCCALRVACSCCACTSFCITSLLAPTCRLLPESLFASFFSPVQLAGGLKGRCAGWHTKRMTVPLATPEAHAVLHPPLPSRSPLPQAARHAAAPEPRRGVSSASRPCGQISTYPAGEAGRTPPSRYCSRAAGPLPPTPPRAAAAGHQQVRDSTRAFAACGSSLALPTHCLTCGT